MGSGSSRGAKSRDDASSTASSKPTKRSKGKGKVKSTKVKVAEKRPSEPRDPQGAGPAVETGARGEAGPNSAGGGPGKFVSITAVRQMQPVEKLGGASEFRVPKRYDYNKSTSDQYGLDPDPVTGHTFYGEFKDIRADMDYSYHNNYTKDRQLWQDAVIGEVTGSALPSARPWIVYTCGPMGAGKGYALQWMSQEGFFPMDSIVHIDPDLFKATMPEWAGYVKRDSNRAGAMCHRESSLIQEIAQEVALRNNVNIWVDGSLRDGEWFCKVYDDIRVRFNRYRIAIFYVYASEDKIRVRVKAREARTGRGVPEEELIDSLQAPDKSLGLLVSKVDFIARIDNNDPIPRLTSFETVDRSGSWNKLGCRFARRDPNPSEFPESLAPINLSAVKLSCEDLIWNVERGERKAAGGSISPSTGNTGNVLSSSSNSLGTGTGNPGRDRDDGRSPRAAMDRSRSAGRSQRESKSGRPRKPQTKEGALHIGNLKVTRVKLKLSVFDDPLRKPYQHLIEDTIKLSPAYLVSLDAESRLLAGVPLKAQKFVFCYGAKSTLDTAHKKARAKVSLVNASERASSTLPRSKPFTEHNTAGSDEYDLIRQMNLDISFYNFLTCGGYIYFDVNNNIVGCTGIVGQGGAGLKGDEEQSLSLIQFGPATVFDRKDSQTIVDTLKHRFVNITLPALRTAGAAKYAWVVPMDKCGAMVYNMHGGFMYLFDDGMCRFFRILGFDDNDE